MPGKWHPYLPRDFLCCLSLQAGVVGCSVVGLTLMLITTLVNIYGPNEEEGTVQVVQYCLLFLYLIVMYIGFMLSFLAAFWEISKFLRLAAYIIGFGLVLFIVYVILSMIPHYPSMINVCPGGRCPDHHWLHEDHWRSAVIPEETTESWTTFKPDRKPNLIPVKFDPNTTHAVPKVELLEEQFDRKDETHVTQDVIDLLNLQPKYKTSAVDGSKILEEWVIPKSPDPMNRHSRDRQIQPQPAFIIVSVINVVCFTAYLLYSLIMFLALARQFDKRPRSDYD